MPEQTVNQASPKSPARRFYKRFWFRAIWYPLFAYVTWCTVLYFYQDHLIFPRDLAPAPLKAPYSKRTVVTKLDIETGGQVESWFIPARNSSPEDPGPVVIVFHGNAEIIDFQDMFLSGYRRLGFSVLLPEYRGYGRSAGKPSQQGIVADAVRFYDELIKRNDIDQSRIVFHGRSLGGGVAADLATKRKPAALILESTFSSLASMAHKYAAPAFLAKHPFRTDLLVSNCDFPLLIFHGSQDPIIPVAHGRRLHQLAPNSPYIEYECGHNDFPGRGNEASYWKEIENFLRKHRLLR